jgi:signal transduction histidine kinase
MKKKAQRQDDVSKSCKQLLLKAYLPIGLLVAVLLFSMFLIMDMHSHGMEEQRTLIGSLHFLVNEVALGHLDTDEVSHHPVTGYATIEDVYGHLDKANEHLAVVEENLAESDWFFVTFDRDKLIGDIHQIKDDLAEFRLSATEAYENALSGNPSNNTHELYDQAFLDFQEHYRKTEAQLSSLLGREMKNFHIAQLLLIGTGLLLTAVIGIHSARTICSQWQLAKGQVERIDKLDAITEDLESIVHISSHDLRSPILNINGFTEAIAESCQQLSVTLNKDQIPEEVKNESAVLRKDILSSLKFIRQSAIKMDVLTQGLLRLSRLGRASLNVEPQDANEILKTVTNTMQHQINESQAEIVIDKLPMCLADGTQLTQVFTNLVDNAVKYLSTDRKGLIRITGRIQSGRTIYSVEDNGIGISTAQQQKVFEIFHRVDVRSTVAGEGLGLSIVRRILENQNGRIWLESEYRKGSKFYFSLPAVGTRVVSGQPKEY